jgi:hypothetical protein
VAAYNFFGNVQGFAVSMNNLQVDRIVEDRKGECRGNQVLNNIFFACPRRIFLGRNDSNPCDGNLFDAGNKEAIFDIQTPAPKPKPRLASWQQTFGQDKHSWEAPMEAAFDANTNQLRFSCQKIPETSLPVPQLGEQRAAAGSGPFGIEACALLRGGKPAVLSLAPR